MIEDGGIQQENVYENHVRIYYQIVEICVVGLEINRYMKWL